MKLMHLISDDAGTQVLTLLQVLCRNSELTVVCLWEGDLAREARERGLRTRVIRGSTSALVNKLLTGLERNGYGLLHCHGEKANQLGGRLRKKLRIPVIATVSSEPDWLNRLRLKRLDGWITESDSAKTELIRRGFPADQIYCVYPGIDFPKQLARKPRQEFLRGLGLEWEEDDLIFGVDAKLSARERSALLEAFEQLSSKMPHARLLIAGNCGPRERNRESVRFCGYQTDWDSFYHAIDVHVDCFGTARIAEGFLQSARMYCTVIAGTRSEAAGFVRDGITGFLVEPGDWTRLLERMMLLAEDRMLGRKLGRQLREKVYRERSLEAVAQTQMEVYRCVLERYRRQQERYGVVICGAYGRDNVGDEAILSTMIGQLRQKDPYLPVCVMSRDPRRTAAMTGVSSIHLFNYFAAGRMMRRSSLYISGGGSLLQNATSNRSLSYYLAGIRQAKKAGCKVMMFSSGIGPITGSASREKVRRVLEECVDLMALRDPESRDALEELGITGDRVHVTADVAMLMEPDTQGADCYLEENGLDQNGRFALFVLRPWQGAEQKLDAIRSAAEYVWQRYGLMPLFCGFEPERDGTINRKAANGTNVPCKALEQIPEGRILCGLTRRMELVVGMRLHALIFACSQGSPMVGISYDPKVAGFMKHMGSGCCVDLDQTDGETLCRLIDQAMNSRGRYEDRAEQLRDLARYNGELAAKLLQMEL